MIDLEILKILAICTDIGANKLFSVWWTLPQAPFFYRKPWFLLWALPQAPFFVTNTISCRERCRRRLFWPNHATFWHDWAVSCHFSALSCNHATLSCSLKDGWMGCKVGKIVLLIYCFFWKDGDFVFLENVENVTLHKKLTLVQQMLKKRRRNTEKHIIYNMGITEWLIYKKKYLKVVFVWFFSNIF